MRPTSGSAVYRPDLGIAVMEFAEGPTMNYIGLELMPLYTTAKNASSYPVIPKEALLKLADVSRSPRGNYNRDDFEYERGLYQTAEKGTEEPIDDSERDMFDQESQGLCEMIATKRAWNRILRGQEYRIKSKIQDASRFTAHNLGTEWDNPATATPVDDINDAVLDFRKQCGMLPDLLQINYNQYMKVKRCDQVVDQLISTFPGLDLNALTASQLAQIFNVPRVLIAGAMYDSSGKGVDTVVSDIWSDEYASLVKISDRLDLMAPGLGRTFLWTADSPQNPIVESYREEKIRSDVLRVRHNVDERLLASYDDSGTVVSDIAAACHYLIGNVLTV